MTFKTRSMLDSLGVGDDGVSPLYPDNFSTDLGAAFDEDMGIADSRIQVLEADIDSLTQENLALKAHNYELLTAAPAAPGIVNLDDAENTDPDESENPEDSDEPRGMDRIFKKDSEDK